MRKLRRHEYYLKESMRRKYTGKKKKLLMNYRKQFSKYEMILLNIIGHKNILINIKNIHMKCVLYYCYLLFLYNKFARYKFGGLNEIVIVGAVIIRKYHKKCLLF